MPVPLFDTNSSKERLERLQIVLKENLALAELSKTYKGFEPCLTRFLSGALALSSEVKTKLECLSEKEGQQLGKNAVAAVKSKKLASSGIDQWKRQNKAAKELLEKHPALERMYVVLASDVVKTAPWGLFWRVSFGATLSIIDLVTDVNILFEFRRQNKNLLFECMVASLATTLLFHIAVTIAVHHKNRNSLLKELFFASMMMKSPRDAYKVASGAEEEEHHLMDPMAEFVSSKCSEVVSEGIPAVIIQLIAMLSPGGVVSPMSVVSLVISILL